MSTEQLKAPTLASALARMEREPTSSISLLDAAECASVSVADA
jgi:hypothetical protein